MSTTFVPLGYHCNITFLTQELNIKTETGLFEWLQSRKLQYITDVINVIKDTIDTIETNIIVHSHEKIYLIHEHLYTLHYTKEQYNSIFQRRAKRFLELIKNSSELIFVRINIYQEFTTEDEIDKFAETIHSINSKLKIKFLLIDTIDKKECTVELDKSRILNVELVQKYFMYEDCKDDQYLRNNQVIKNLFSSYMSELGYNVEEKNIRVFTDKD